VCRRRYHEALYVLHWLVPGSVWAMDFAEPPLPLDGRYSVFPLDFYARCGEVFAVETYYLHAACVW